MSSISPPPPFCLPEALLKQHIAVLGKTGSGKTCTAKLLIEHVVPQGARVCVLDTIKSDWWGLTSSADGGHPGLPFHILGGPRGHVPLHAQAGAAIGEIVGNGSLPLSILDMVDFEMGGLQQFFTHFAPALIRKMRGVLYLVIEEAHECAPKERGGFNAENMAIHFAKKLATAGRSKGIRLIVATQRIQALHNSVLGSCDTLIAHRLVAPADQEPVKKWLKANLTAEKAKEVGASLQSLQPGEAWVCAGEHGLFERIQFPRIATYDNSATPTDSTNPIEVSTAPVDLSKLRAIIGTAIEEAKANDPAALKKQISNLQKELEQLRAGLPAGVKTEAATVARPLFTADDQSALAHISDILGRLLSNTGGAIEGLRSTVESTVKQAQDTLQGLTVRALQLVPENSAGNIQRIPREVVPVFKIRASEKEKYSPVAPSSPRPAGFSLSAAEKALLAVIVYRYRGDVSTTRNQAAVKSGYAATSGHVDNTLGALRSAGYIEGPKHGLTPTPAGAETLGAYHIPLQGRALVDYWLGKSPEAEKRMLAVLAKVYPGKLTRDQIANQAGYAISSGHVDNTLGHLRALCLITGNKHAFCASAELMQP